MSQEPNQSEVARLRAQIEAEHEAMVWAMTGLRDGNTKHAYISRRMGHLEITQKGLSKLVGEEAAMEIICEVWEKTPMQETPL